MIIEQSVKCNCEASSFGVWEDDKYLREVQNTLVRSYLGDSMMSSLLNVMNLSRDVLNGVGNNGSEIWIRNQKGNIGFEL